MLMMKRNVRLLTGRWYTMNLIFLLIFVTHVHCNQINSKKLSGRIVRHNCMQAAPGS